MSNQIDALRIVFQRSASPLSMAGTKTLQEQALPWAPCPTVKYLRVVPRDWLGKYVNAGGLRGGLDDSKCVIGWAPNLIESWIGADRPGRLSQEEDFSGRATQAANLLFHRRITESGHN